MSLRGPGRHGIASIQSSRAALQAARRHVARRDRGRIVLERHRGKPVECLAQIELDDAVVVVVAVVAYRRSLKYQRPLFGWRRSAQAPPGMATAVDVAVAQAASATAGSQLRLMVIIFFQKHKDIII